VRLGRAMVWAAALGYSLIAATTTPFTLPADVLTAVAIVALAAGVAVRWPWRPRRARARRESSSPSQSVSGHPYLPWCGLVFLLVAWELFNYLAPGTRAEHPTFSSITDAIDRFYLLKTLLFLAWLYLGWAVIASGARRHRTKAEAGS
jgi:hypothetical protein